MAVNRLAIAAICVRKIIGSSTRRSVKELQPNYMIEVYSSSLKKVISESARSASFRCLLIWQKVRILAHMRYDDDCLRHMTLRSNQSSSKLTLTMSCLQLIFCSGDEVLISLFRGDSNTDIYKQMASVIRNRPAESITPEERAVRRVNFLIHHKLYLLAIIWSCFSSVLTEFSTVFSTSSNSNKLL